MQTIMVCLPGSRRSVLLQRIVMSDAMNKIVNVTSVVEDEGVCG